jgi:hypothetical protein
MWECRINLVLNGNRHREREFVIHWVPVLKLKENSGQEHLHASTITEAMKNSGRFIRPCGRPLTSWATAVAAEAPPFQDKVKP